MIEFVVAIVAALYTARVATRSALAPEESDGPSPAVVAPESVATAESDAGTPIHLDASGEPEPVEIEIVVLPETREARPPAAFVPPPSPAGSEREATAPGGAIPVSSGTEVPAPAAVRPSPSPTLLETAPMLEGHTVSLESHVSGETATTHDDLRPAAAATVTTDVTVARADYDLHESVTLAARASAFFKLVAGIFVFGIAFGALMIFLGRSVASIF